MAVRARLAALGGKTGPAVLMIHGFGADSLSWAALMPHLSASCRVFAVDLPGHGKAPADIGDGTIDTLAAAVETAAAGLERPFALVGHSLGGAVAMAVQERIPEAVGALTLIAPAGLGQLAAPDFLETYPEAESEGALQPLLTRLVTRDDLIPPILLRHVLTGLSQPGRRAALRQLADTVKSLGRLGLHDPTRTHLIWGTQDAIMRFDPGLEALGLAAIHHIPDCGHLPHVEAPAPTARAILAALGAGPSGGPAT